MSAEANERDEAIRKTGLREVMVRLWPTLRPYRYQFALGLFLIVLSTVVEVVVPIVIGRTVDAALLGPPGLPVLYGLCGIFLGLTIAKSLLEAGQAYTIQSAGQRVTHDLRSLLFRRIELLPVAYFDRNPTGRLLTRIVNDVKSLNELFTASMSVLALDFMIIVGTVVAMFWVNWRLALSCLISFPVVLFTIQIFGTRLAKYYRIVRLRLAEINSFLGENIAGISTIQRLGAERERFQRFSNITESHNQAQMDSMRTSALVQPITNGVNGLAMGTLIIAGGYWAIQGTITVGLLVAFFGYLRNLFQPVRDLVEKYNTFLSAMVSAERVVGILAEPTEWENVAPHGSVEMALDEPAGIRFEDVSFHYPLRLTPALREVSFDIAPGTSVAIVGATGSGKSTIIRLLLRFYEPQGGTIYLGGSPLTQWNKQDLRRHIGVVHQDIYLFQGTVRDNLTLGRTGHSDEFLREQCERAQLWNFIQDRGGLDMQVLEGGTGFSVGEKQLLSFARILVSNPPLLILDEATSSVDRLLERKMMSAIGETMRGRTSVVIAHRLSTIEQCHRIIVIDKAQLVEEGTFDSLLRGDGLFAKFHELHSRA